MNREKKKKPYFIRRQELSKLLIESGSPKSITQKELAQQYGVSQAQISKDIEKIREEYLSEIGKDAKIITSEFYKKALHLAQQAKTIEEATKGAKIVESWNNWLFNIGAQQKATEPSEEFIGTKMPNALEIYKQIQKEEEEERLKSQKVADL